MKHLPIMVACLVLQVGCNNHEPNDGEKRETGPSDLSVSPEMLVGARYRGRTGGDEYDDLNWVFDKSRFRIVAGKHGLPPDISKSLLPSGVNGNRVDGKWSVEGEELTLSDLKVDGVAISSTAKKVRVFCTPVIRIEFDKKQYMFARGTPESARAQGEISD